MNVLSPFDEAIRDFANAQQLLRIKKLLVYACTHHWETDPDRLAQFNLHYLIETLMRLAPTVEQLKTYLNQVTQTLSKPAEYLLVANTIVQTLQKLYSGPISSPHLNANPHIYWQIAQVLEQEVEHLRIRKLLVLICRNYWENDRDRLLTISVPDLLTELHQLTQSFDHLKAVVNSVVQTTSKPAQYGAIAQSLTNACRNLYASPAETDIEPHTSIEKHEEPVDLMPSSPTFIVGVPLASPKAISPSSNASGDRAVASSESAQSREALPPDPSSHAHSSPEDSAQSKSVKNTDSVLNPPIDDIDVRPLPTFSKSELYDLRLEIMKYTVPLLSKHLLFLAVYVPPGQASAEEQADFANDPDAWMTLKGRDLDDLILASLKQYRTLRDLSAGLKLTVRSLRAAQRYAPVADAIVRAVKTLTVKHRPSMSGPESIEGDRPTQQEGQGGENTQYASPSTVNFYEQPPTPQSDVIRINMPGAVTRKSFSNASTQATSSADETAMFSEERSPSESRENGSRQRHTPHMQARTTSQEETFFHDSTVHDSTVHDASADVAECEDESEIFRVTNDRL